MDEFELAFRKLLEIKMKSNTSMDERCHFAANLCMLCFPDDAKKMIEYAKYSAIIASKADEDGEPVKNSAADVLDSILKRKLYNDKKNNLKSDN